MARRLDDENGLLYDPDVRVLLGSLLEPNQGAGCEALVALAGVGSVLTAYFASVSDRSRIDRSHWRVLRELVGRDGAVTTTELRTRLDLDETEMAALLGAMSDARLVAGADTAAVHLAERGRYTVTEVYKWYTAHNSELLRDVPAEQLPVVRHTCFGIIANDIERDRRETAEVYVGVVDEEPPEIPDRGFRYENGLRYDPATRDRFEFVASGHRLAYEVVVAMAEVSGLMPSVFLSPEKDLARLMLPLYWEPGGLSLDAVRERGGAGARILDEAVRAGVVERVTGAVRLTEQGRQLVQKYRDNLATRTADCITGIDRAEFALLRNAAYRVAANATARSA